MIVSPAFKGTKAKSLDLESFNLESYLQNKDVTTALVTFRALIEDSISRYIPLVEGLKRVTLNG